MMTGILLSRDDILARIQSDSLITEIPDTLPGQISHGVTECGYDFTLGRKQFSIGTSGITLNPKLDGKLFFGSMYMGKPITIGPSASILTESIEVFNIPTDLIAIPQPRAVYNNFGLSLDMSPLYPGYKGKAVLRLTNTTQNGVIVYPGEGVASLLFFSTGSDIPPYGGQFNENAGPQIFGPVLTK